MDESQLPPPEPLWPYAESDPVEPVVAYKLAHVVCTRVGEYRLTGLAGADSGYDIDSTAHCAAGHRHRAPHPACGCGFWAVYELTDLASCIYDTGPPPPENANLARLTVELSGPTELHTSGLRSSRQRILHVALSPACAVLDCSSSTTTLAHPTPPTDQLFTAVVLPYCDKHVPPGYDCLSPVDLANALGTEVALDRDPSRELTHLPITSPSAPPKRWHIKQLIRRKRSPVFYILLYFALLATAMLVQVLVSSFSSLPWQDFSSLTPAAHTALPATVLANRPVALTPLPTPTAGTLVFDLGTHSCVAVLPTPLARPLRTRLTTQATSYSTTFGDKGATATPYQAVNSANLIKVLAASPPYVVAHLRPTTASTCAALASSLQP